MRMRKIKMENWRWVAHGGTEGYVIYEPKMLASETGYVVEYRGRKKHFAGGGHIGEAIQKQRFVLAGGKLWEEILKLVAKEGV